MDIAYLGLFADILSWIMDKILSPVFKFIANLLSVVLGWVFDTVLGPLIEAVVMPIVEWAINMVFELLATVFFKILQAILTIIDYIQIAFDVLIGLTPVTYRPAVGPAVQLPLLDALFGQPSIRTVFLQITLLGLGIAFLLAIYAAAHSAFDLDMESSRPVGQVLKTCMKTAISFLMVPLFVLIMIKLSGLILSNVDHALKGNSNATLGNTIFLISSLNAAKVESFNTNPSMDDALRHDYNIGKKTYHDFEQVKKDFKLSKIDYIVGYGSSIFMVIILGMCLILFVQRIFEIIILYIVSPLFVSIMPLDEGEKFGKWREIFIAKMFTGFGSAIGMRVYLMVIPIVMGNTIDFTAGGQYSSEMNYVIKLIFVIGGAWSVLKSSSLITSLLNFQAAQSESMVANAAGGAIFAHTAGKLGRVAVGGAHKMMAKAGAKRQERNEKEKKAAQEAQAFREQNKRLAGGAGIPGLSKAPTAKTKANAPAGVAAAAAKKPAMAMSSQRSAQDRALMSELLADKGGTGGRRLFDEPGSRKKAMDELLKPVGSGSKKSLFDEPVSGKKPTAKPLSSKEAMDELLKPKDNKPGLFDEPAKKLAPELEPLGNINVHSGKAPDNAELLRSYKITGSAEKHYGNKEFEDAGQSDSDKKHYSETKSYGDQAYDGKKQGNGYRPNGSTEENSIHKAENSEVQSHSHKLSDGAGESDSRPSIIDQSVHSAGDKPNIFDEPISRPAPTVDPLGGLEMHDAPAPENVDVRHNQHSFRNAVKNNNDNTYDGTERSYSDKSYGDTEKSYSDKSYNSIQGHSDDNTTTHRITNTSHSTESVFDEVRPRPVQNSTESVFGEVRPRPVQSGKNIFDDDDAKSAPQVDPLGGFVVNDDKASDTKNKGDKDKK